jgi:hypothetical protein
LVTGQVKEILMALTLDAAVAKALEPMAAAMADSSSSRRCGFKATCPRRHLAQTAAAQPMPTDVTATDFHAKAADGADILLRWYVKERGAIWSNRTQRLTTCNQS